MGKENFKDLAPVSKTLGEGYREALDYCIENENINNVAITGPFGAGKSSLLKSYKENLTDDCKLVEVSLASFKSQDFDEDEIEIGILQQLIYSHSSSELPYSNFKRIKVPEFSLLNTMSFLLWIFILVFILFFYEEIVQLFSNGYNFQTFLSSVFLFFYISVFLYLFSRKCYEYFHGFSVRKVSFSNLEIDKGEKELSFINKNIDEFLYFFESTRSNLVIFEDLDRLNSDEIFVKLRELNNLVNNSHFVKKNNRKVKFFYALSDAVFHGTEKTKFFDFVIPVIPVVNSESSFREMKTRNLLLDINFRLNEDFLMDVSVFINEARVINNVFNEYYVYKNEIGLKDIEREKLFSILLYKCFFSEDFERLHHGYGFLKSIVDSSSILRDNIKNEIERKISNLENQISKNEKELLKSQDELTFSYLFKFFCKLGNNVRSIRIDGDSVDISSITADHIINNLKDFESPCIWRHNGTSQIVNGCSFSELERDMDSDFSFSDRIRSIRDDGLKKRLRIEIKELKESLDLVGEKTMLQLLERVSIDDFLKKPMAEFSIKAGGENKKIIMLFRYLLLNGYLDENYNFYTSIFKERDNWTERDQEYYRMLKSRMLPDYNYKIDNPKEILKRFDEKDFSSDFILNSSLFEYIFDGYFPDYSKYCFEKIKSDFDLEYCQKFMKDYLFESRCFSFVLNDGLLEWPDYIRRLIGSRYSNSHVYSVINNLNYSNYKKFSNDNFKEFLVGVFEDVFSRGETSDSALNFIKYLDLKVFNISSDFDGRVSKFLVENCLFEINLKNIDFALLSNGFYKGAIDDSKYGCLSEVSFPLKDYVDSNINKYVDKVMLPCDSNRYEEVKSVLSIINNETLSEDLSVKVIKHQNCTFSCLDELDEGLWEVVLSEGKVKPSWIDCFKAFSSSNVDNSVLLGYLSQSYVASVLEGETFVVGDNEDDVLNFKRFLVSADSLENEIYISLNRSLGAIWKNFSGNVSDAKKVLLISNGLVSFNEDSYSQTDCDSELRLKYILQYPYECLLEIEDFKNTLDQDLAFEILKSDLLDDPYKIEFLKVLDKDLISFKNLFVDLSLPFYLELEEGDLDKDVMEHLIRNASDLYLSLELYKKYFSFSGKEKSIRLLADVVSKWDQTNVMSALSLFSAPISTIADYGRMPTIPYSDENLLLANQLSEANYISSRKIKEDGIKINTWKTKPI